MSLKDKYAIVGIGYTPQGYVPGRTSLSFHLGAQHLGISDLYEPGCQLIQKPSPARSWRARGRSL